MRAWASSEPVVEQRARRGLAGDLAAVLEIGRGLLGREAGALDPQVIVVEERDRPVGRGCGHGRHPSQWWSSARAAGLPGISRPCWRSAAVFSGVKLVR